MWPNRCTWLWLAPICSPQATGGTVPQALSPLWKLHIWKLLPMQHPGLWDMIHKTTKVGSLWWATRLWMKFDILTTFLVDEARAGLWPARNVLLYQTCSFFLIFFRRAFQRPVLIFQKPYPSTPSAPWMQVRPRWRVLWLWSSLAFHAASHPHRHPPLLQKPAKDYLNSYLYDRMQYSNPGCTWRWAASTTGPAPSCAAAWPCMYCVRIPSARLRNQKAGIK